MSNALRLAAVLLVLPLLAACARTVPGERAAAKVNGIVITIAQLRTALARVDAAASSEPDTKQVIDQLIDRELLVQRAEKAKLDKDPGVKRALESSRKQILAQAYVEQRSVLEGEQGAKQVSAFYAENRANFEDRRLYRLFELGVSAPEATLAAIRVKVSRSRNINDLVDWLKSRDIPFNVGGTAKFSEQIPKDILEPLASMSEGQIRAIDVPGGLSIIQLLQSQKAPLGEEEAAPMIERSLAARARLQIAAREISTLRKGALIEYADLGAKPTEETQPGVFQP
jgi:EpsD family peptidyl-prolyl cis-trans isomerase